MKIAASEIDRVMLEANEKPDEVADICTSVADAEQSKVLLETVWFRLVSCKPEELLTAITTVLMTGICVGVMIGRADAQKMFFEIGEA